MCFKQHVDEYQQAPRLRLLDQNGLPQNSSQRAQMPYMTSNTASTTPSQRIPQAAVQRDENGIRNTYWDGRDHANANAGYGSSSGPRRPSQPQPEPGRHNQIRGGGAGAGPDQPPAPPPYSELYGRRRQTPRQNPQNPDMAERTQVESRWANYGHSPGYGQTTTTTAHSGSGHRYAGNRRAEEAYADGSLYGEQGGYDGGQGRFF